MVNKKYSQIGFFDEVEYGSPHRAKITKKMEIAGNPMIRREIE